MTLPKFIITSDGHLRLGWVHMHRDLLQPGDKCFGGGYFFVDSVSMQLKLDRSSYDYGRPMWHLLTRLVVPHEYRGMSIVYSYDDDDCGDVILSDILTVEYI